MATPTPSSTLGPAGTPYTDTFFSNVSEASTASAQVIVPMVLDLVRPQSVIDVGCGLGQWARAFRDHGVPVVRGYDGAYVDRRALHIELDQFTAVDLTRPLVLDRRYDLAICLEVAEHLPTWRSAGLVRDLTAAAPVVLFSAAIPGQGGTNHVNEQWPPYWRGLFAKQGYVRLDPFRPRIWRNPVVAPWYRQNLYLFASGEAVAGTPALRAEQARGDTDLELVLESVLCRHQSVTGLLAELLRAVWRAVKRRTSRGG
jgi:hypothetical protein